MINTKIIKSNSLSENQQKMEILKYHKIVFKDSTYIPPLVILS